jgi:hypothetical protein
MCSTPKIIILNTEHWLSQHLCCSQTHLKWHNCGKHIKYEWITFTVTSKSVPPWTFKWFIPDSFYNSDNTSISLEILTFVPSLFCMIRLQQIHELSLHNDFPTKENYWHTWLLKPLPVPFYPSSLTPHSVHVNPTINSNTEKVSKCVASYEKFVASTLQQWTTKLFSTSKGLFVNSFILVSNLRITHL